MSSFICPVCAEVLKKTASGYQCKRRHYFDVSKSGYVNLLMSQQSKNKRHGDDKAMVRARRDFLDNGYYSLLLKSIVKLVLTYFDSGIILDAGCGECWYTAQIRDSLVSLGKLPRVVGVDISKNALELAAKRGEGIERAVASIFNLPVADNSCDLLLNIFAPHSEEEFYRVLKRGGKLIRVIPLERHLWQLKQRIYDVPYKNNVGDLTLKGFNLIEQTQIEETIKIYKGEDILNLFMMTPYYYKTSQRDFQKLLDLDELETEVEFAIIVYEKI